MCLDYSLRSERHCHLERSREISTIIQSHKSDKNIILTQCHWDPSPSVQDDIIYKYIEIYSKYLTNSTLLIIIVLSYTKHIMRYLLQTTYKQKPVNLTISADTDFDIKKVRSKIPLDNLVIYEDNQTTKWDIQLKINTDGINYTIISDQDKVIDAYELFTSLGYDVSYINSLSKPLDDKHMQALLMKLKENLSQKKTNITPAIVNTVEEMQHDIISFVDRFTWYTEKKDLDYLTELGSKLSSYLQIWDINAIKNTISEIITKMEILENSYVKSISTDTEQDQNIAHFNKQLSMIMDQNKAFRNHGLNVVSWWSKLDYMLYRFFGKISMFGKGIKLEFRNITDTAQTIIRLASQAVYYGITIALVLLAFAKLGFGIDMKINWLKLGAIGFCAYLISRVKKQKTLPYMIKVIGLVVLWILLYYLTVINLGI